MKKERTKITTIFIYIFGRYRIQVTLLVILGFLGGMLEGVGVSAVIPALSFLFGGGEQLAGGVVSQAIKTFFVFFSIPFSFRYLLGMIAGLFILRAFILGIFTYVRARIGSEFVSEEMSDILSATFKARWPFLLKQKIGFVQNTIVLDVRRSANLLDVFTQVIQSFSGLLVYLIVALSISPRITLLTLGTGGILLFVLRPLVKKTQSVNEQASIIDKQFSQHMTEHIGGIKVVKASGEERRVLEKAKELLSSLQVLYVRNIVVQALGTIFIQPFSIVFIIIIFAFAYKAPGFNLAAFAATLYLIQKIFIYLQSGQSAIHSVSELLPYAANVLHFKDNLTHNIEVEPKEHKRFNFDTSLQFKNIGFAYDQGADIVLKDVSFIIKKGETIGLIGPSGAGKTSVADLFLRLFNPTTGEIILDGVNIQDIDLQEWRSRIGYVSQDIFLVNETIRHNIQFYEDTLSQEDIERATKQAHIYDFISCLPEGFDTIVGDKGVMLSVGQRQRIALARVLARRPDILVLDEATSALDNESELLVQKAINELRGKVTVFIIAHRLSTIMNADRLLVLRGGRIEEEGKPQDLLQNKDSYFYKVNKKHHDPLVG
ncbi:MAG: ABC transporter ATP-binding protein [Candidatus Yonathbacteria bacterium]|nr:ABC transporter ATP-binding protein [Candidatus Yonathbacteria bacterium]